MADKPITGQNGDLKIGGTQRCHITSWVVNPTIEFVGFNSNCTGAQREKIGTIIDWTASFEWATEKGKCPDIDVGDFIDLDLNTSQVAGFGCTYSGNALVTGTSTTVAIDGAGDLVTASVTVEGNGVLTKVDNP